MDIMQLHLTARERVQRCRVKSHSPHRCHIEANIQPVAMKGRYGIYATTLQKLITRFSNVSPSSKKFDDSRIIMEWIRNIKTGKMERAPRMPLKIFKSPGGSMNTYSFQEGAAPFPGLSW